MRLTGIVAEEAVCLPEYPGTHPYSTELEPQHSHFVLVPALKGDCLIQYLNSSYFVFHCSLSFMVVSHSKTQSLPSLPPDSMETPISCPVVETFHSVQGEGVWSGTAAFFIRLAGCDVGCQWCDTKISWSAKHHPKITFDELGKQTQSANPAIVVVTGGEPLMHNLQPLTSALKPLGIPLHLETSGSHPLSGQFDWITLSPKTFKHPQPEIYDYVSELKVVIDNEDDLTWAESQATKVPATVTKYLQPQWSNPGSQDLIFQYILSHPDWRMGLQTHKFVGLR